MLTWTVLPNQTAVEKPKQPTTGLRSVTTIQWIAVKFDTDLHSPKRMNPNDVSSSATMIPRQ